MLERIICIFLVSCCILQLNAQKMDGNIEDNFRMESSYFNNETLPDPVKKYFRLTLNENQSKIKSVQLTHHGFFKTSPENSWMEITGKQYFKTDIPEFEWTGKTKFFKAVDKYCDGEGKLTVKLFSVIPIVNAKGPHIDQAELLRWLGESFWYPTNLLPGDNLRWLPIDSFNAQLNYSYNKIEISYLVRFNEIGEITQLETKRYKEKGKLEKWIGKVSDYKYFEGFKIPTHVKAFWDLKEGPFQYVDFFVDTIEYRY